ncbi:HEAT repeat domain-containing protein [Streptomyces coeruleorubidus]|uniref:HEAT repeat domain-containing protein n=1 Tax=Streptomyces coeruleorubidus TaxID=116188 RepID=A0ABZ0KL20_STRC4|nr:HEAT repeat domain-containing protein [Streptomyces coeruleorubidus]WOT38628.1 HEAT repeat domain-containing protein [Streptomyces coeruleorubidus]
MFRGIDEVDWASLRHAYGSAEDVPGLLRGLASADQAERETALDRMYGAVHHQGGVYDSTLACVPFLLALAVREEVRDRAGVVELLVSIGGADGGGVGAGGGEFDGDGGGSGDLAAQARAVLRAGADVFVPLAGDADAGVRRAAPAALVRFLDRPARVLALLRERLTVERDDRVLLALTESLGLFARRHLPAGDCHAAEAVGLLAALSGPPYEPGPRLAALGQLAQCAPELLPADLVPTVVRLLRDRSGQRGCERLAQDGPGADTLAGRLRRLRPSDEEGSRLLRTLHSALGGRVADRVALLCGQLTSPDPLDRCNGVWMSAGLFREWRTDVVEPVALIGAQLGHGEGRLHDAAVAVLVELFELALPASDHLHALVTGRPELRVRHGERGAPTVGGPLRALARAGDARATPVLAEVLAGPVVPHDLGLVIPHLGRAAAPLAPALRRRLARVPLDGPDTHERAVPLLTALTALGDAESVPSVLRLLRGMPDGLRLRGAVTEAAVRALGAVGSAAHEAIPDLRGLLETDCAVAAADALCSVTGEADAVVPVLLRELTDGGRGRYRPTAAADVLGRLGPAARTALPALRRMTGSGEAPERAAAACAVWRITGEPEQEQVLPVLRAAWTEHPRTRTTIAGCVAALGLKGAPLHDLLRAELTSPRRHRADSGGCDSHGIHEDEGLLRLCRGALSREGGG